DEELAHTARSDRAGRALRLRPAGPNVAAPHSYPPGRCPGGSTGVSADGVHAMVGATAVIGLTSLPDGTADAGAVDAAAAAAELEAPCAGVSGVAAIADAIAAETERAPPIGVARLTLGDEIDGVRRIAASIETAALIADEGLAVRLAVWVRGIGGVA